MSVETDMLYISVIGPKANVTRMLNEAIRQEGAGELIVDGDDIETINRKITGRDGKLGMMVKFAELIDEKCLEDDALLKERWQAAVESHNQKMATGDTSDGDYEIDIELFKVEEYDHDSYEVKFSEYVPEWTEDFDCIDWADWEDIARVYKCRVFVDDNYYRNGEFMRFESATIYEPGGEKHRFESGTTGKEYDEFMDKLAELYPERYRPLRTRYLKEKDDEKERQHLEEERHIKLNYTVWSRLASWEEDGVKAINGVYDRLLKEAVCYDPDDPNSISTEDILNVLKVRAEKWKGVNDEFASCYEMLVQSFGDDLEQKQKEFEDRDDKWIDEILASSDDEPTSQYPIDENGHAVIPEGTTRIDDYAFLQCDKLVSVSIPNTVEEIGEGAFGSCKNLISITLPSALKLIDEAAFFGCEKLAGVEIPAGLQRIEARAFAECSSLDDIEIPIGVKVADDAFRDCPCEKEIMRKH